MKRIINKILLLLFIIPILCLCGCEKPTIYQEKTIIVNIDSDIVPNVTASFGEGTLNEDNMVYTHKIPYIKNLTLYFSKDGYKTEELNIYTSEMENDVIEKSITFGNDLQAIIEVNVLGVNNLNTLSIKNDDNIYDLTIINNNTFSFRIFSRSEDYNLTFNLDGYKEFNYTVKKETLVSGYSKIKLPALLDGQMYIGIYGGFYNYRIYNAINDIKCSEGYQYNNEVDYKFIILPDDSPYYVQIDVLDYSFVWDINSNENIVLDISEYRQYFASGYLNLRGDLESGQIYLYFKDKQLLSNNKEMISSIDNIGILYTDYENFYYLDDVSNLVYQENYYYYIDLSLNNLTQIEFNINTYDRLTDELVDDYFKYYSSYIKAKYENGAFYIENYAMKPGYLLYDIVDQNGNVIYTYKDKISYDENDGSLIVDYENAAYVNENFEGTIVDGQIEYNRKIYLYKDAITLSEVTFNGEYYTCNPIVVDTSKTLVKVIVKEKGDYYSVLHYDPDIVILDEDMNIVNPIDVNGEVYLELLANVEYSIKANSQTYKFTPSEKDIESGFVLTNNEELKYAKVNIPTNTYAYINAPFTMKFYPDEQGNIYVPLFISSFDLIVDFGKVKYYKNINSENEVTIGKLYSINGILENVECIEYIDNIRYYVIEDNSGTDQLITRYQYLNNTSANMSFEPFVINKNEFVYNESTNSYFYDIEGEFDYIIAFDNSILGNVVMSEAIYINEGYMGNFIYINEGETMTYNNQTYTISGYDSKYLFVSEMFGQLKFEVYNQE